MNDKVKELLENHIEVVCEACMPYICVHWDKMPLDRIKLCSQLEKWLNRLITPDLALIDRDKKLPTFKPVLSASKEENNMVMLGFNCGRQDMLRTGCLPVILIAEAIKEINEQDTKTK